jgi:hypothetical protein
MPTILMISGWRFFFYANERHEPVHVHCRKGDAEAKYCTTHVQGRQVYGRLSFLSGEVMRRVRERGRMDKAHDVQHVAIEGKTLRLRVDGKDYEIDITKASNRLANATAEQRANFEVSPAAYGIHWPDADEDLSIDGLIGIRHPCPLAETKAPPVRRASG